MHYKQRLIRLINDEGGHVAISFGMTFFILLASVGGAIDMGRAIVLQQAMQETTDSAALNGATLGADGSTSLMSEALASAKNRANGLGGVVGQTSISYRWVSSTDFEVKSVSVMPTGFLSMIPGFEDGIMVRSYSLARSHKLKLVTSNPEKADLSFEAGDYNQVWAYCFDPAWQTNGTRTSDEGTKFDNNLPSKLSFAKTVASTENRYGRSDFTLISHNGDMDGDGQADEIELQMPTCKESETISYMLFNSRMNRTTPANWGKNNTKCGTNLSQTGKTCYTWYTDTRLDAARVEQHNGTSPYQLETVLCEDKDCNTLTDGGYIPGNNQRHRIPQKVKKECEPGKFMYFGWEDRPPQNQGGKGLGNPYPVGTSDPGGDRDYDDIRLIVSCPVYEKDSYKVRLIK